jgi:hypothetical protein
MRSEGSISVALVAILMFLSVLFIGATLLVEMSMQQLKRSQDARRDRERLRQEAARVTQLMTEDPTPFADSPLDPVWQDVARSRTDGLTVTLADASSFLGANWVRKELVDRMGLLLASRSPDDFQQFREDTGFHQNLLPDFKDFFGEPDLRGLFTTLGWLNVNIADEFTLRKLYYLRSGDSAAAEQFHQKVQEARVARKMITPDTLRDFMGDTAYQLLFPLANAEPSLNMHFASEEILRGIIDFTGGLTQSADLILSGRLSEEWTTERLAAAIGPQAWQQTMVSQYLGVRTWFWKLSVSDARESLTWTLARIPTTSDTVELRLVEEAIVP